MNLHRSELPLSGAELSGLLRAVLAKGASFRFRARGFSMSPFIREGDVITIAPPPKAGFRSGDIVAFIQPANEALVVHRVVAVRASALMVKGDNLLEADGLIPISRVMGVVSRVERDGRDVLLGLGPERRVMAFLNRVNWLHRITRPAHRIYRLVVAESGPA